MVISSASSKWTPRTLRSAELADEAGEERAKQRHRPLLDREQLERARGAGRRARPTAAFSRASSRRAARSARTSGRASRTDTVERLGSGGRKLALTRRNSLASKAIAVSTWAEPVGQAERINLVAAIEHRVGEPGAAEEHADHRPLAVAAVAQRDQLALDDDAGRGRTGRSRSAARAPRSGRPRAEVERDEVGLAARQHRDRRRASRRNGRRCRSRSAPPGRCRRRR